MQHVPDAAATRAMLVAAFAPSALTAAELAGLRARAETQSDVEEFDDATRAASVAAALELARATAADGGVGADAGRDAGRAGTAFEIGCQVQGLRPADIHELPNNAWMIQMISSVGRGTQSLATWMCQEMVRMHMARTSAAAAAAAGAASAAAASAMLDAGAASVAAMEEDDEVSISLK